MNFIKKTRWSQTEIIRAMEENMLFQMTYFAKHTPTLQVISQSDVTIVMSEVPDDTFNYIIATRFSEADAPHRIASTLKLFEEAGLPFSWWVGQNDTPSDLGKILVEHGLSFKEENIGMFLNLDDFQMNSNETSLAFERVVSVSRLIDFSRIIIKIGGHRELFEKIYSKIPPNLYQQESDFEMYVGYVDREPVVSGIMVLHEDVAGIYYVTTIPTQRKKGFGTDMMKYLLTQARNRGYYMATLQASKEGKGLYERLGFTACGVFKEYAKLCNVECI